MNLIPLNIKHLRELRGLKQKEVGEPIGMKHNTISNYEHGKSEPRYEELLRLAGFFEVPVEMILKENLPEKWRTIADFRKWQEHEARARQVVEAIDETTTMSSVWLEVLSDFMAEELAHITGKEKSWYRAELDARYNRQKARLRSILKDSSFDSGEE